MSTNKNQICDLLRIYHWSNLGYRNCHGRRIQKLRELVKIAFDATANGIRAVCGDGRVYERSRATAKAVGVLCSTGKDVAGNERYGYHE